MKTTVLGRKSPLAVPAVGLGCMGMVSAYRVLNELYPLLDFLEYGYDVRVQLYLKLPRKPCNPTTLDFREGRANCAAMYGSAQVLDTRPRAGGSGPELVPGDTSIFRERGGQAGVCGVAGGATSHKAQGHGNRAIKEMRTHLFWCVRIFVKPSFSFLGLSAWRWACAVPRCGSMWPRSGQRSQNLRLSRRLE